jgi:hypothetical protein
MMKFNFFPFRATQKTQKKAPVKVRTGAKPKAKRRISKAPLVPNSVDDIQIDMSKFPVIKPGKKPHHQEYETVRDEHVRQALNAVLPYYSYLVRLEGIKENKAIQRVIGHILIQYIAFFWDLPSSANHHHSEPWGGLVHALDTACREAEIFLEERLFGDAGLDSQRMRREKYWLGFAGFVVGLLHDAEKIHNVQIEAKFPEKRVLFDPNEGNLLDFNLTYPGCVSSPVWVRSGQKAKPFYSTWYLLTFLPRKITRSEMPRDIFNMALDKLLSYEALLSDQRSVEKWSRGEGFYKQTQNAIGQWYLHNKADFLSNKTSAFIKLDSNWYAADKDKFFSSLAHAMDAHQRSLTQDLISSGIIAARKENFYATAIFFFEEERVSKEVLLVKADIVDHAIHLIYSARETEAPRNRKNVFVAMESKYALKGLVCEKTHPPLAEYIFKETSEDDSKGNDPSKDGSGKENGDEGGSEKGGKRQNPSSQNLLKKHLFQPTEGQQDEGGAQGDSGDSAEGQQDEGGAQGDSGDSAEGQQDEGGAQGDSGDSTEGQQDEGGAQGDSGDSAVNLLEDDQSLDQKIAQKKSQRDADETPFYKFNGSKISDEMAIERLRLGLERIPKKRIQARKHGMLWLSRDNTLWVKHPQFPNLCLDLPGGRISQGTKVLRSKFLNSLQKMGFILSPGKNPASTQQFEVYCEEGDRVGCYRIKDDVYAMDFEKTLSLSEELQQTIKNIVAMNRAMELEYDG